MNLQERKKNFEAWWSNRQQPPVTTYFLDAFVENINEPPILRDARACRGRSCLITITGRGRQQERRTAQEI